MKNLSINQWASKVEALKKKHKLTPKYLTAEIHYRNHTHLDCARIIYVLYLDDPRMIIENAHPHLCLSYAEELITSIKLST